MTEENTTPTEEEQTASRVFIGFHQLGGLRLVADDVRLSPQEAFILAGQLLAHATMTIQMGYTEDAMRQAELTKGANGLIMPPGMK